MHKKSIKKNNIVENLLREYITMLTKLSLSEVDSMQNHSGQHAQIWAGGGSLEGIPNVEGVSVEISRYGNDLMNIQFSVDICVTDDPSLDSGLHVFKDENEAKHFARMYIDNIARTTKFNKRVVD